MCRVVPKKASCGVRLNYPFEFRGQCANPFEFHGQGRLVPDDAAGAKTPLVVLVQGFRIFRI